MFNGFTVTYDDANWVRPVRVQSELEIQYLTIQEAATLRTALDETIKQALINNREFRHPAQRAVTDE